MKGSRRPLNMGRTISVFLSLAGALAVAGACALSQQPTPIAPNVEGLSYGSHAEQKIDLWMAKGDGPRPLAIFIHGGGFQGGSRKQISPGDVKYFLDQGISVASFDYRLTRNGPYPMPMNDCARALQFLRSNADIYKIDKRRIASYGGSAGACISLWLAFHDDMAKPSSSDAVERESTRLICAGSQNGQSTLDPRTIKQWFGVSKLVEHPALYPMFGVKSYSDVDKPEVSKLVKDASPITHLTRDDPPVFMQNGGRDLPVDESTNANVWVHHPKMGIKLKEAMDKLGIECHVVYQGSSRDREYKNVPEFLAKKLLAK